MFAQKTRAFYVDEIDTWNMFSEKKDFLLFEKYQNEFMK
jgi:hypothetical protein